MPRLEARLSSETVHALMDLHRDIRELKYLYLRVVESHSVNERVKSDLKDGLAQLADQISEFFNDLRFRRINKFNVEDTEAGIRAFATAARQRIEKLLRSGARTLQRGQKGGRGPAKRGRASPAGISASEAEVDAALLDGRVFEERALEKDKLDRLNAVKSFVVDATAPSPDPQRTPKAGGGKLEGELLGLKVRNYAESLAAYQSSNLDVLYRARAKIEKAFRDRARVNVVGLGNTHPASPNHGELYVVDHDYGNYSLSFRDRSLGLMLHVSLYQPLEAAGLMYSGEVTGWAEAGINRVAFALKDRRPVGAESSAAAAAFLEAAGLAGIYERMLRACREKATEAQRLQQKVEHEMKQAVCDALDESL